RLSPVRCVREQLDRGAAVTRVLAVVEGRSEELFLQRVLAPHLASRGVYVSAMKVLRGKGARGGGSSWQPWRTHIEGLLKEQPKTGLMVTTLLDLYRIPRDTPGYSPPGGNGEERAEIMLRAIRDQLGADPRLVPYIQVHEFEALLYSDLNALTRVEPDLFPQNRVSKLERSDRQ